MQIPISMSRHGTRFLGCCESMTPSAKNSAPVVRDTLKQRFVFPSQAILRIESGGGYRLICDRRLQDCGHQCLSRCHSESMHQVFPCPKRCERLNTPCGHVFQQSTCREDCGLCMVPMNGVSLLCGHFKDGVECHLAQDPRTIRCGTLVSKVVPGCSHTIKAQFLEGIDAAQFVCP
ncbi:hypothetical protein PZA11_005166 [Diplocarpon coronariae]